jgi:cbb3-type cytochrome oxidase subunit 3
MSELMSSLDLWVWPSMALVIFLAVFVAIVRRTLNKSRREEFERAGQLPLSDAPVAHLMGPVNRIGSRNPGEGAGNV